MRMHISRLDLDTAAIASNIACLAALGVQVHITELDLSLALDPSGAVSPDDLRRPAAIYRGVVRACLQNPGCTASKPGGSPTNIRGSDLILMRPVGQPCLLTAPTSPARLRCHGR